jgi:putative long chain acyl-CoA synthase
VLDEHGLGRECAVDEVGLLLVRVNPADSTTGSPPLRGVFEGGDTWHSTGDLFLRDEHGDLWLAGPLAEVVKTPDGPVLPSGTRFALSTIPSVDLVVAYGITDGDDDVLAAAVTLRAGTDVDTSDLDKAIEKLPTLQRPRWVQVVPSIPVTTWHRPQWRPLQAKGVPTPSRTRRVWRLGRDRTHYEPFTTT